MSSPQQFQLNSGSQPGRYRPDLSSPPPSPRPYASMQESRAPPQKQLSVTQIQLNRAYALKALEGHQMDIERKTRHGTIQRNETWNWLRNEGYGGPIPNLNQPIRRLKTLKELGFNDSWIIIRIDESTGVLQQVWKGKVPQTGGWI